MAVGDQAIDAIATRHGLTADGVRALAEALARGRGVGAQWNHPDLGGMGQWLGGGLLQIGAMFDADLKRRVAAALDALTGSARRLDGTAAPTRADGTWWPEALGTPASSGAQNATRYACFPAARRLVVDRNGAVSVYDTGPYRLTGVSQAQSTNGAGGAVQQLVFTSPDGPVRIEDLARLS